MMSTIEVAEYWEWLQELGAEQPAFVSAPTPLDSGRQPEPSLFHDQVLMGEVLQIVGVMKTK